MTTTGGGHGDGANAAVAPTSSLRPLRNGLNDLCPKCNLNDNRMTHHGEGQEKADGSYASMCFKITKAYHLRADDKKYVWIPEHMHRWCGRCSYEWAEAPLT